MNPYQVMGGIACCTLIFAGVVTFLTIQGVPLLVAFLGVYLLAIWIMMGMQRRARQLFEENSGINYQRRHDREARLRADLESNVINNDIDADATFSSRGHFSA
ncbi:MAG: hypothetical protein V3U65_18825 [Granulosicoccaceae bacterium]